jgi:hypothetical protein
MMRLETECVHNFRSGARLKGSFFVGCWVLIVLSAAATAQQSGPSGEANAPSTAQQEPESRIESGQPRLTKEQAQQALAAPGFTPEAAQALLERLTEGLESHNASKARSVFDAEAFASQFFSQINAAFDHFEIFRVYYHVESVGLDNAAPEATVDFRLERVPRDNAVTSQRSNTTLQFKFARAAVGKGRLEWRIAALEPQDFLFGF